MLQVVFAPLTGLFSFSAEIPKLLQTFQPGLERSVSPMLIVDVESAAGGENKANSCAFCQLLAQWDSHPV
jgi:hypothetical protein